MAGKASKKQVQTNTRILGNLYKASVPILLLSLARALYSRGAGATYTGTMLKWMLINVPLLGCLYTVEVSGRPHVVVDANGSRKIVKEGLDLSQTDGLLQYLFDVIYLSLFANCGRILFNTNKLWYILWIVPCYAAYKLYGLKQQFFGGGSNNKKQESSKASSSAPAAETKSKRQMKREKKGENQVKYKYR